jgi:hypothetical protein
MSAESQEILLAAEKYWVAARALDYVNTLSREDVHPYYLPETFDELTVVQPKMVLDLFSTELYLKALLAHRYGDYERTHNLSRLFRNLPDSDKKTINERWAESIKTYSNGLIGDLPERNVLTPEEVLHEVRDFFRRWRYSFDSKEMEAVYNRKQVVPEIFDVPEVIRAHVREVVGSHSGT